MAGGRSAEVAAASVGLDTRTIRRVRRLVSKGQAAPDCAGAKLAVALARGRQRAYSRAAPFVFALLSAGVAWLGVKTLQSHGLNAACVIFGAIAIWFVWSMGRAPVLARSARKAELANMQRLVELGEPYPSRPPTGVAPISAPSRLAGAVASWAIYDLSYGALTLAFDGKTLSLDRIVGRGAIWAVLMVAFNLIFLPGQRERQSEKPTVGQRGV
jgi:hypothetical protein